MAVDSKAVEAYTVLANFYRLQPPILEALRVLQDGIARSPDGTALYIDFALILAGISHPLSLMAVA